MKLKATSRFDQLTKIPKDLENSFQIRKIAAGCSMHADKTRYIILYGIASFVKGYLRYKTILCHKVALDV